MADARQFAKLDLGYFDNPKVADFLDEHPHVPMLHLRAILYCRQHLTDGVFPVRLVARMVSATYCGSQCDSDCDFCRAVAAGLMERGATARQGIVHDYLEHQQSAEDVRRLSNAGKKGAAARWGSGSDANRDADRNAKGNAEANAERGEERRGTSAPAAPSRETTPAPAEATKAPDRFPEFWAVYPRKKDKGHALKAWTKATKTTDPQVILDALHAQAPQLTARGVEFCPYPATWLNGQRWADETDTAAEADPWAHLPHPSQRPAS